MTYLKYLENTYLFENISKIIEIGENNFGKYIILDETIFYPQGGGQPSDQGEIGNENGVFFTKNVRLDENGIVYHYGEFKNGILKTGESVNLKIDSEKRLLNAKNHSAGHLIDIAVQNLGIHLEPTKGFHFPEGGYVEYIGVIEGEKEDLIQKINNELKNLISKNIQILTKKPKENGNILTPKGKQARIVYFEGYEGCGCGGTHLNNTKEIGNINIRNIKTSKGETRVSYSI